jgi:tripartite ATP-independent transporter DctM subunit
VALTISRCRSWFLILGVPVAFAIGLSAFCTILYEGLPVAVLYQQMMSGMNVFSFLAIPFFIFSGELMLYGGVADKIVNLAKDVVGHIRGGLGMSNVVACTLFGGVCGSAVADVSAMGAVMIPMMKKEGYHADYAVNVTTHSALVGALMPTSHNMIIYALAAGKGVDRALISRDCSGAGPDGCACRRYLVAVKRLSGR